MLCGNYLNDRAMQTASISFSFYSLKLPHKITFYFITKINILWPVTWLSGLKCLLSSLTGEFGPQGLHGRREWTPTAFL